MKQICLSNFAGQIIHVQCITLKGDNEDYQEYLDRVNTEIDSQHDIDLELFDVWNMNMVTKEEIKSINEKDTKDFIKNYNVITMLIRIASDSVDIKLYHKMIDFACKGLLQSIAKLKKWVNNKKLYEIPLQELFSIIMEHIK